MSVRIGYYPKWVELEGVVVRDYASPSHKNRLRIDFGDIEVIDSGVLESFFSTSNYDIRVNFPKLSSVNATGMRRCFAESLTSRFKMPRLVSVDDYGMYECYNSCKLIPKVSLKNLETVGSHSMERCFFGCQSVGSIYMPKLNTVSDYGMSECFSGCSARGLLDLGNLTKVGKNGMKLAFAGCPINTLILDKLTEVGESGLEGAFWGSELSGEIELPKLKKVGRDGLYNIFGGTRRDITDVYLNNLSIIGNEYITPAHIGCPFATIHFKDSVVKHDYNHPVTNWSADGYIYNHLSESIVVTLKDNSTSTIEIESGKYAYVTQASAIMVKIGETTLTKDNVILSTGVYYADKQISSMNDGFVIVFGEVPTTKTANKISQKSYIKTVDIISTDKNGIPSYPIEYTYDSEQSIYSSSEVSSVYVKTTDKKEIVLRMVDENKEGVTDGIGEMYCVENGMDIILFSKSESVTASFNLPERNYEIRIIRKGETTTYKANTYYIGGVELKTGDTILIRTPYGTRPNLIDINNWKLEITNEVIGTRDDGTDILRRVDEKWKNTPFTDPYTGNQTTETIGLKCTTQSGAVTSTKGVFNGADKGFNNIEVVKLIHKAPVFGIDVTYENRENKKENG